MDSKRPEVAEWC